MKRLALLTPWPPQHTGIADYAYDLAAMLVGPGIELDVFTTETAPTPLSGVTLHSVGDDSDLEVLAGFDTVIYQLGNNTNFHLWMMPLLGRYPGVIHLHDLVMHHMAAWLTWVQGDAAGYLDLLEKWYGPQTRQLGLQTMENEDYLWESERVTEYPLSEEYLQEATAVIVHSNFALDHVRRTTVKVPSFAVPQLYQLQARGASTASVRHVSVLGGVDPQKRVDWVIEALGQALKVAPGGAPVHLHIVGGIDPRCEHLRDLAEEHRCDQFEISLHGRVSAGEFDRIFQHTDLCIALRYPTMGETSAIVMKALQYGIPTIVNELGWYRELPDTIVKKLPTENCQLELANLLAYLLQDARAFANWSGACAQFAREAFSTADYGSRYLELCSNPEGAELVTDVFTAALRDCGFEGSPEEDSLLDKILGESSF